MAGRKIYQEHQNTLTEHGAYYIYEKGQLCCPPGYSKLSKLSATDIASNDTLPITRLSCYNPKNCSANYLKKNCPPSLLKICTEFVALHIEYVDSLVGLPEIIGHDLFTAVIDCDKLVQPCYGTTEILKVFGDAYSFVLMENLVMKSALQLLNNCTVLISTCFQNLKVLNLDGCSIGDDHDMIEFIGNCKSLEHVGLCNNSISDDGVQKLSAPMRIFHRGPAKLYTLDLSCNPLLTDRCMKYFGTFKHLAIIDLSGTKVTELGTRKLELSLNLVRDQTHCDSVLSGFENQGWMRDVMDRWLRQTKQQCCIQQDNSSAANFYSRKKLRLNTAYKDVDNNTPPKQPLLVLKTKNILPVLIEKPTLLNCKKDYWSDKGIGFVCGTSKMHLTNQASDGSQAAFMEKKRTCPKQKVLSLEKTIDLITDDTGNSIGRDTNIKRKFESEDLKNNFCYKRKNTGTGTRVKFTAEQQKLFSNYLHSSDKSVQPCNLFEAMGSENW